MVLGIGVAVYSVIVSLQSGSQMWAGLALNFGVQMWEELALGSGTLGYTETAEGLGWLFRDWRAQNWERLL